MSDKKTKIYNAVISLLNEKGLLSKDLKVSEIADKADIGKGTIYEYFESKDQVIVESLMYSIKSSMEKLFLHTANTSNSFEQELKWFIDILLNNFMHNYNILDLVNIKGLGNFFDNKSRHLLKSQMDQIRDRYSDIFNNIITLGIREGIIQKKPDIFTITVLEQTILSICIYFSHRNTGMNDFKRDEITDRLYSIILKLLV